MFDRCPVIKTGEQLFTFLRALSPPSGSKIKSQMNPQLVYPKANMHTLISPALLSVANSHAKLVVIQAFQDGLYGCLRVGEYGLDAMLVLVLQITCQRGFR